MPEEHGAWVDDLLSRYDVPPAPTDDAAFSGIGGLRIDPRSMAPLLDVLFGHKTRLVASALGPPPAHFIERAHDSGIPVAALAGSVEHARRHVQAGADLIVAQGTEAGGHTGLIATMVLVPEVVDVVAPVPVLAANERDPVTDIYFAAFFHVNLAKRSILRRFPFHRCLVGLDFGEHFASRNPVALLFLPRDQSALGHCVTELGHLDFRHGIR